MATHRYAVGRHDTVDLFISTARVSDGSKPYETAIRSVLYDMDGSMCIVEAYNTKEDAKAGHEKWLEIMTNGPWPDELVDCQNARISQMREEIRFKRLS